MGNLYSKSDAEEKMEVEASSETEHQSASYTEEGSDVDKAEPFVGDPQQPSQPAVQIGRPQQAVCKLIFSILPLNSEVEYLMADEQQKLARFR